MPTLSHPKHERFAQELAKGKSQSEAYVAAGYAPSEPNASRLTRNDKVRARVAEIQNRAATRVEISKAWVLQKLRENAETCLAERKVTLSMKLARGEAPVEVEVVQHDPAGANRSLELIGKELGMFVDRAITAEATLEELLDRLPSEAPGEPSATSH